MSSVVRRVSRHNNAADTGLGHASSSATGAGAAASDKRISLAQMLKSREMKNLMQQALVANKQFGRVATIPEEQSRVIAHWIKLLTLKAGSRTL
ncbi:hypothetical protein PHYSODRAFT_292786 [Phytophthora sojae]|nr:hypothetical protein PHYSODRAFT_289252 [Phytophthora sojae]XP_009539984.1 hypothetical protein PHYSODRAFT_292786 [Phytophthora sojae]EGZ04546.1 hypothetical protein PHYSODRAFT_292786 [Phytophthora sojae]EGZ05318.1 hypothetical protein PHYSODRAFT_289252 [Phytophthora sojae]|eukprot:XP_009539239.1 hypothetical protein PHYSODRAFT_289252 [Phytophthora sojae]